MNRLLHARKYIQILNTWTLDMSAANRRTLALQLIQVLMQALVEVAAVSRPSATFRIGHPNGCLG